MAELIDPEAQKGAFEPPKITPIVPDVLGALEQLRELRSDVARIHLRLSDPSSSVVSFSELNAFLERCDQEILAAMHKLEGGTP